MAKFEILNESELVEKIKSLLATKDLKNALEDELREKIESLKQTIANAYADTPELAKHFTSTAASSFSAILDQKITFSEFLTLTGIIEHYIGVLAGARFLTNLGWEFKLSSETFNRILNAPKDEILEAHTQLLTDFFDKYIDRKGQLELETKIKLEGFSFYIVPRITACLFNLLSRLTDADQFLITHTKFNQVNTDFFVIESEDKYLDDDEEEVAFISIKFKDEKYVQLLNDIINKYKASFVGESDEDDYI